MRIRLQGDCITTRTTIVYYLRLQWILSTKRPSNQLKLSISVSTYYISASYPARVNSDMLSAPEQERAARLRGGLGVETDDGTCYICCCVVM